MVWGLDPNIDFLNHGSFGSCPTPVLEEQSRWRALLERDPVDFVLNQLEPELDRARSELAAFLGAFERDLVFVANTTTGVNAVLAGLSLSPGDEILVTDHTYSACRNAASHWSARAGARVVTAQVPFPLRDPSEVLSAVLAAVTPRTRLALIDHVTSPTALVMPVEELTTALGAQGVQVLVDGAHAPGMLPLALSSLGADYYVGNLHKWCCAPKGSAFLHVRDDRHGAVRPIVVSHGYASPRTDRSRLWLEFDWLGTHDPSAVLSVPAALRFLEQLEPGGIAPLYARNTALARRARRCIADRLELSLPCPDEMVGAMAALPLPLPWRGALDAARAYAEPLYSALRARGFQVPVSFWPAPPDQVLRISAHAYNRPDQYERLAQALAELALSLDP